MNKKEINPNICFADSMFDFVEMDNNCLTIYLTSWDAKSLKVCFHNPIWVHNRLGDFIAGAYEILDDTSVLNEAISRYYSKLPSEHPFKVYRIEDLDDFPLFEIVAENAFVIKTRLGKYTKF